MGSDVREVTAYCGLYCGDCIRYRSKAAGLARELLGELQATEFGKYAEVKSHSLKELEDYERCCRVLEALVELQCNKPCRIGGGCPTFSCGILECCQKKGFEGCWECSDYEGCGLFEFLEKYHGEAPKINLGKIKELGIDRWAGHREKFFVWQ